MKNINGIKYFTRLEAAKEISVPASTLEYWAHKKKGPAYYKGIGGREALYRESDINAFIESLRKGGSPC